MNLFKRIFRLLQTTSVEPARGHNSLQNPIDEAIRNINADRERIAKRIEEIRAPQLNLNELKDFKTSDTLFILGSGPSINQLSSNDWKAIERHDSIGFNFFLAHDFVPTFYHMELVPANIEFVRSIYPKKSGLFHQTPFLINGYYLEQGRSALDYSFGRHPAIFAPSFPYYPPFELKQILQRYAANNSHEPQLFHYRGSLTISLSLAAALKYQNVVLVGVDLNTPDYFFFDEQRYLSEIAKLVRHHCLERQEKQRASGTLGTTHRTIDKSLEPQTLTIDEFIEIFHSHFLVPLGVDVGVAAKQSSLVRVLPFRPISLFH